MPDPASNKIRLVKYLAHSGVASRRASEKLIAAGRIVVDGKVIRDPAFGVSEVNRVEFNGSPVVMLQRDQCVYVALHKPFGVLSTMSPGLERGVAVSRLVDLPIRLYPVGRLDRDSSGLLLLTNDGVLTHQITHPRHRVSKEYHLKLGRDLTPVDCRRIEAGVEIEGRKVEVDSLRSIKGGKIAIAIHEGRKRILRRLFKELGHNVVELKRVGVGPIALGKLSVGKWRYLSNEEVTRLKSALVPPDSSKIPSTTIPKRKV
jgi:23S rRNA pseudouridine2605 synthase